MKKSLLLAAALCFSVPALAQSLPERTGVNSMMGIAPKTDDFIQSVAWSDQFEIQSSHMALSHPALNTYATRMISDHQKTSHELKQLLSSNNITVSVPDSVDNAHQEKLDSLHALQGDAFNRQYRSDQISAHEDAVSLFRRYANGGEDAALKKWAADTLPVLEDHLRMAKSLPE